MYNPFSLAGKTILVTGASSGIGRATAVECSRMGARLCITGRDGKRLEETFLALEGEGHMQLTADLTDERQIADLVARLPMLDGIVHSAGVCCFMPVRHIEAEDIRETMDINFTAVVILNRELILSNRLNTGVSFVFISSLMHCFSSSGYTLYAASKGALISVSLTLARELGHLKCRSNVVSPAMIDTPMALTLPEDVMMHDKARYPLGYGKPEDVAWACVYLLSDAARWISRSEFPIHGGLV